MPDQFIVIVGNPVDGLTFVGPFEEHEAAIEYGDTIKLDWWVARVETPESYGRSLGEIVASNPFVDDLIDQIPR